jgi:hypothetical protein
MVRRLQTPTPFGLSLSKPCPSYDGAREEQPFDKLRASVNGFGVMTNCPREMFTRVRLALDGRRPGG